MKKSIFTRRGFLFTISIIMFASTLVFFAQTYVSMNASNESAISSSAKNLNALILDDSISYDLSRLFDVSLDANRGTAATVFASGSISSSPGISSALSSYESVLNTKLFPLLSGSKFIDFSNLKDGKAEAFYGGSFEFDYDYSANAVDVFPLKSSTLSRLDLNIRAYNDLNHLVWLSDPVAGESPASVYLNYFDDSNFFSYSPKQINPNALYALVLVYPDSNIYLYFGAVGGLANSAVMIYGPNGQRVDYSIKATYSDANVFPVVWNSVLRYSDSSLDSNAMITVRK